MKKLMTKKSIKKAKKVVRGNPMKLGLLAIAGAGAFKFIKAVSEAKPDADSSSEESRA